MLGRQIVEPFADGGVFEVVLLGAASQFGRAALGLGLIAAHLTDAAIDFSVLVEPSQVAEHDVERADDFVLLDAGRSQGAGDRLRLVAVGQRRLGGLQRSGQIALGGG